MKTMPNKTDRNYARALAQIMRTGWFRRVHVKSRQCRLWRSLLVARRTVLNEMRSIENVTRATLREAGIKLGAPSRADFGGRVRELTSGDSEVAPLVEPLLAILATMLREFARLTKRVLDLAPKEKVCRQLMSVPGVGPITALAFRATVDRRDRFKHSRDVGAHLGLTPARYQSGETDIQGRIRSYVGRRCRIPLWQSASRIGGHYCRLRQAARKRREEHSEFAREGDPDRSRGDDRQAISLRSTAYRYKPARS